MNWIGWRESALISTALILLIGVGCEPALNENECQSDEQCRHRPGTVCSPERWCVRPAAIRPDAAVPDPDPDAATPDGALGDAEADAESDAESDADGAVDGSADAAGDAQMSDADPDGGVDALVLDADLSDGLSPDVESDAAADEDGATPDAELDATADMEMDALAEAAFAESDAASEFDARPDLGDSPEDRAQAVFYARCTPCHIEDGFSGLSLLPGFPERTIGVQSLQSNLPLITRRSREDSYLFRKLDGSYRAPVGGGVRMPQGGPILDADDLETVGLWIDSL